MATIGLIFPPDQPPERLHEIALATEAAGIEELWLWEDCFKESGMAPAGAVLAWTEHLRVGIGLFPVPLRNVALTAMEIATLARLFPERLLPGIGHGVLDWMGQVGARVASPLTLLREYGTALRRLLEGENVTVEGRYVNLNDVQLSWPPQNVPLLVGAEGPKTLALAGEIGDGIILTGGTGTEGAAQAISIAQQARRDAGIDAELDVVSFLSVPVTIGADELSEQIAALTAVGATRVSVCGVSEDGPPDGSERILGLLEVVGQVAGR
ncbi:LLM class flavin-dependent oxidoreductase [Pseudactinotalea suaedae]|uniref:LLM class flavin-dependent oxidoreductase n=1 Tax=Pseudactinotalea suaedae TaxID=1524924 RepID=UPI0012E1191D|nr:LLM class flavin-dependent oxidoreductase [Pseudactinotalea suaedae]